MSLSATNIDPVSMDYSQPYRLPLHGLAALRILIILAIGVGYASTMPIGPQYSEWGAHWGFDPSWYGIQLLFILSGFLAVRSMANGRSVLAFFASRLRSLWPALISATLVTAFIIYPLLCAPDAPVRMTALDLVSYTLKTIFLIDPGARMPGLLDSAKYMCLLQGAIWTLRFGLILHVGFLLGWKTRILQNRWVVLGITIAAISAYVTIFDVGVKNSEFGEWVAPFMPALRLGYAYLVGIAIFLWQHKLRLNARRIIVSAAALAAATTAFYMWLPWSSVLEIMGVTVWLTICLGFLHNAPKVLQRCPRLSPVLYVCIWPAAQIMTALSPNSTQMSIIQLSLLLSISTGVLVFLLLRQARIQPARL